ncbi:sugar 1,4-lactone oxidase [Bacillus cereus VD196]|uniref:Sugar 1,4-lactone oxidase n=2 Tax=Bacillus cereus TaxID=1396 RepID=A0A9W5PYH5_BACCE|nr:sugar 1,4-lactone oxidase [Bacillus cereus VD196]
MTFLNGKKIKKSMVWRNWAGNIHCRPKRVYTPNSEEELTNIIQNAAISGVRVKVVGAGHSCSEIAVSDESYFISMEHLNHLVAIDKISGLVTVQAGIKLADLNEVLDEHNLALPNLGAIDEQSIAGAINTGTHGTGMCFGTIASFVVELQLLLANGNIITCSSTENSDIFHAARVGLGSLGVITRVTLACVPAFNLNIEECPTKLKDTIDNLDQYLKSERFGFWWFPHTDMVRLWIAQHTDISSRRKNNRFLDWIRDVLILNRGHEVALLIAAGYPSLIPYINRFIQKCFFNRPKSRVVRSMDGFRHTILVRQVVLEYAIPLSSTAEALYGMKNLIKDHCYKVHHPIDVRFGGSDDSWLSPAQGRDTCYIGIIMYRPFGREIPYENYFKDVDNLFARLGGRPHWGKVHYRSAKDLRSMYPYWNEFLTLRQLLDPEGMFLNDYLERVFGIGG